MFGGDAVMLKVTAISSIDYLTDSTAPKGQALAYYTDSDAEPPEQIWWPGNWLLPDGAVADVLAVKRMAQGRHPKTGKQLVDGNGSGKNKSKRVGYDLTFSAPVILPYSRYQLCLMSADGGHSMMAPVRIESLPCACNAHRILSTH